MNEYLSNFDLAIIGVYFLILIGMGLYLQRRASQGLEGYFLANKKLPWWMLGVTGMGWSLDVTGTMLIISLLYLLGPRGLFIEFRGGANLSLIFMMIWTGKWHRRSNCMTGAEWMTYRFGDSTGGHFSRIVFAVSQIVFAVGMLAYMVKGVGLFMSEFIPLTPFWCAVAMIGVATVYTMMSGFYGVVFSDLFQCALIIIGILFISIKAIMSINEGGGAEFHQMATEMTGIREWASGVPQAVVQMPRAYEMYECLMMFTFFLVLKNVVSGFGTGYEPHYFAARNERDCGKLTALWACLMTSRWPMMMGFAILGLFMVKDWFPTNLQPLQDAEIAIKSALVEEERPGEQIDFAAIARADDIIPRGKWEDVLDGKTWSQLPEDETRKKIEAMKQTFGDDWKARLDELQTQEKIVQAVIPKHEWDGTLSKLNKERPELAQEVKTILDSSGTMEDESDWQARMKLISYEGSVHAERILPTVLSQRVPAGIRGLILITLIAASMSTFDMTVNRASAFFTRDIYQKFVRPQAGRVELMVAIYSFIIALVGAAFAMGYYAKSINDIWGWIMMGLGSGLAIPLVLRLYWWRFNGAGFACGMFVGLVCAVLQRLVLPELHEVWQFISLTLISAFASIVGTFLAPPTDRKVLEHFYKTTRPFGFWKPLQGVLDPVMAKAAKQEHKNDMMAFPFAFIWIVSMFMLPILFMIQNWTAFGVDLAIFLCSLVGMYKFWYKNLPPDIDPDETAVGAPVPNPVPSLSTEAEKGED